MNPRSLPFAALVLVAACSRQPARVETNSSIIDVPGGTSIETSGVRIEVEDSVRYRYTSHSTSPGATASEATLNGHPFGVRDGVFYIGSQEFGAAPKGALVRVSDEGVFVDGERRGAMPAEAAGR